MEHFEFDDAQQHDGVPAAENMSDPQSQPAVEPVAEPTVEPVAEPTVEPVWQAPAKKASPFADSPYVMNEPPKYEWESGFTIPPKPKKEKKHRGRRILAWILTVALVIAGCGITYSRWQKEFDAADKLINKLENKIEKLEAQLRDHSHSGSVSGPVISGTTPSQVYASAVDSVVAVTASISVKNFGQVTVSQSTGSGFILSEDGYIATNYHVVENATSVEITTNNQETYSAEIVGYDAAHDLAVLKANATDLSPAKLGSSDDLIIGDQVVVIGNPLGELTATLTVGYISGKDRGISTDNTYINMLQTDAAINSGNSGGPMFNMKGEVVGITTAKYSGSTSSGASIEGIGFAIPIDDVAAKIQDLMEYGYVTGAYLGVAVRDMDPSVADAFGLPMGAYVAEVTKGYCAEKAGVLAKDVIIGLGDHKVGSLNDLTAALQNFKAGDSTTITVWRAGAELELSITLDEKPHN